MDELWPRKRKRSFAESVVSLIGHLLGTAVIFVSFFGIAWGVGYLLHFLDAAHKFPEETYRFISKLELWVIYADALLCTVVLIAGAIRFVRDLLGVER